MKRILITGVAGFIGSHLVESLLSQEKEIIGIDNFDPFYSKEQKESNLKQVLKNKNFCFLEGDISQKVTLESLPKIELIIHLAAKAGVRPSIENPTDYIQHNIQATNNILEFAKNQNIQKIIFASSSSIYGNNTSIPFREEDLVNEPISPYAFTKRSCELMNYAYHHLYDIDIINLRFFTVYGPRQRPDLAIHKFFQKIYNNEPIEIFGDGSTARDYTYIDDIINGIEAAINYIHTHSKVFETINLGNNTPVLLKDLIKQIEKVVFKPVMLKNLPMQAGDVNQTYADITKAKKLLGYNPHTKLEVGLEKFKNWFEGRIS